MLSVYRYSLSFVVDADPNNKRYFVAEYDSPNFDFALEVGKKSVSKAVGVWEGDVWGLNTETIPGPRLAIPLGLIAVERHFQEVGSVQELPTTAESIEPQEIAA